MHSPLRTALTNTARTISQGTVDVYNIALGKRAFWLATTLDPIARGLHTHVSLFICTFARLNKNSETRGQKQQQTGLYQSYEVYNA